MLTASFGHCQHLGYYGSVRYLGLGLRIGFPKLSWVRVTEKISTIRVGRMRSFLGEERTDFLPITASVSKSSVSNYFSVLRFTENGLLLDELDTIIRVTERIMMILNLSWHRLMKMNEVHFSFGFSDFRHPFRSMPLFGT